MSDIIAITASAIAALTAIGVAATKIWHSVNQINDLLDDWRGTPARPGVPRRPGVLERLSTIEEKINENSHRKQGESEMIKEIYERITNGQA